MVMGLRLVMGVSALLLVGSAYAAGSKDVNLVEESQQFTQGNKVAIVAGLESYTKFSRLDYAVDDAQQLAGILKRNGYKVNLLSDQEASRKFILNAIEQAGKMLRNGEGTLVFFFSGHGGRRGGENYLATVDTLANQLDSSGLSESDVVKAIRATGVRRAVLFLDACRDNPVPGSKAMLEHFVGRDYGEGIQILYSTSRDDFSWESQKLGHGVFSYFLNQGLSGQAAQSGVVTFASLARYVEDNVSSWTFQNLGTTQQPRQSSEGEPYGPFVLAQISDFTPSPELASISPPIPTPVTRPEPEPTRPVVIASVSPSVDGGGELARQKAIAAELLAEEDRKQQEKEAKVLDETQAFKQQEEVERQLAEAAAARYRNNGDGTVTDVKTGLMWKRCMEGRSGEHCEIGQSATGTWNEAMKKFGVGTSFAGYDDWRMPTIDELLTLHWCSNRPLLDDGSTEPCKGKEVKRDKYTRDEYPTIALDAFPSGPIMIDTAKYWSSSVEQRNGTKWVWIGYFFGLRKGDLEEPHHSSLVRLVRKE